MGHSCYGAAESRRMEPERLDELREDFDLFDRDSDGTIDFGEFEELLDGLGADMSTHEARTGFHEIDTDADGKISFTEFVEWWAED